MQDKTEEIENIEWTVTGKVKKIQRYAFSEKPDLEFYYDPMGQRITKTVYPKSAPGVIDVDGVTKTYYVYDSQGNVMTVYTLKTEEAEKNLYLSERMLYGSTRLGMEQVNQIVASTNSGNIDINTKQQRVVGDKIFEMSNYLGNILATVTDRKLPEFDLGEGLAYYKPDVVSYSDYSPFGVTWRDGGETGKYGFNGMEKDDEIKGKGNSYDFGARMYDSRVGRFLSRDKFAHEFAHESPYLFAGNSPILFIDINGDFKIVITEEAKKAKGAEIKIKRFEAIVKDMEGYLKENPRVLDEIVNQTGFSKERILSDAKYGEGPTIFIGVNDIFPAQASLSDFIDGGFMFDYTFIDFLENSDHNNDLNNATLDLIFGGIVLHEYTHYLDREKNDGDITGISSSDIGKQKSVSKYNHRGDDVERKVTGTSVPVEDNLEYEKGNFNEYGKEKRKGGGYFISEEAINKLTKRVTQQAQSSENKKKALPKDQKP